MTVRLYCSFDVLKRENFGFERAAQNVGELGLALMKGVLHLDQVIEPQGLDKE